MLLAIITSYCFKGAAVREAERNEILSKFHVECIFYAAQKSLREDYKEWGNTAEAPQWIIPCTVKASERIISSATWVKAGVNGQSRWGEWEGFMIYAVEAVGEALQRPTQSGGDGDVAVMSPSDHHYWISLPNG